MRLWVALLLATACDKAAPPNPVPSASAPPAPVASAAPIASAAPSAAGPSAPSKWSGSYEAQHYKIEVPKGEGAREWHEDDGGAHTGKGTIALELGPGGRVSGTASGALGEHALTGELDGDTLRVRFVPRVAGDRAFGGFTVLKKEGDAYKGRLQAASGDSKTVRDALISLRPAASE